MSLEFDTLYNNIMSNQAPGLNAYEKSLLLNKAQDEIVKNHLEMRSRGNMVQLGVDDSPKRQIDFSSITETRSAVRTEPSLRIDSRSLAYELPKGILMILNEVVNTSAGTLQVMPLQYGEYTRLMQKPYKYPLKGQAWRLISDNKVAEVIVADKNGVESYVIRYIRQPRPIVLEDIDYEDLGFRDAEGTVYQTQTPCELDPILHEDIVQRAVELAKAAWSTSDNMVAMGQRTE